MRRYFEFQDSKSYKFWQIEMDSLTLTVKFGKIGTVGQEKVSTFASEQLAQKEMAKLIAEKTKKGYVEKGEASSKKITRRISVYDEDDDGTDLLERVSAYLATAQAQEVESLIIGTWENPQIDSVQPTLDLLADHPAKLGKLRELFVGDMESEDCEISWIMQGDYTRIFTAFPELERLHIKGSTDLVLSTQPLQHDKLQYLTIECGGLPNEVIQTLIHAKLPNLRYLRLYLGSSNYGFDASIEDLHPFMQAGLFPKLTYLGLVDSEITDQIALEIVNAPVLEQLETLDLSLGTLSDEGGNALLKSDAIKKLKKLDLHYHFLSNNMVQQLKKLPLNVDLSQQQDEDEESRYPAVTE